MNGEQVQKEIEEVQARISELVQRDEDVRQTLGALREQEVAHDEQLAALLQKEIYEVHAEFGPRDEAEQLAVEHLAAQLQEQIGEVQARISELGRRDEDMQQALVALHEQRVAHDEQLATLLSCANEVTGAQPELPEHTEGAGHSAALSSGSPPMGRVNDTPHTSRASPLLMDELLRHTKEQRARHERFAIANFQPEEQKAGELATTPSGMDFVLFLPEELSLELLKFFDVHELARLCCVSRDWKRLAEDGLLWKSLARKRFRRLAAESDWDESALGPLLADWKCNYRALLDREHFFGKTMSHKLLSMPANSGVPVSMCMARSLCAVGSSSGWLVIVNVQEERVVGHWQAVADGGSVKAVILRENLLLVLGEDKSVVDLWDLLSQQLQRSLGGNSEVVSSIALADNRVFTGSLDGACRVIDLGGGGELMRLKAPGAASAVHAIAVNSGGDLLAAGDAAYRIVVWSTDGGDALQLVEDAALCPITCLCWARTKKDDILLSGASDLSVRLWAPSEAGVTWSFNRSYFFAQCPRQILGDGKIMVVVCYSLSGEWVAFGSPGVFVIDLETDAVLKSKTKTVGPLGTRTSLDVFKSYTCAQFSHSRLCAGSSAGVHLWTEESP